MIVQEQASQGYPVRLRVCFRNFSTVSVDFWSLFSEALFVLRFFLRPTHARVSKLWLWTCPVLTARRQRESPSRAIQSCLQSPRRLREGHTSGMLFPNSSPQGEHMGSTRGDFVGAGSGQGTDTLWTKRDVSDGHRPNHGNPRTGMLSTVSTSSHSSTCCSISSDSGRMICWCATSFQPS